jgi:hypothetical protein
MFIDSMISDRSIAIALGDANGKGRLPFFKQPALFLQVMQFADLNPL